MDSPEFLEALEEAADKANRAFIYGGSTPKKIDVSRALSTIQNLKLLGAQLRLQYHPHAREIAKNLSRKAVRNR